jgi:molybdopterin-guanine dinucleotide biosynthesis protein MobB
MRSGHRIHSAGTMVQDIRIGRRAERGLPRILTVAGLKRSGKTTVAAALIRELRARGFRVGSVKSIRHHPLSLDTSGADTRTHAEAGAEFTIALLDGELAYFEPRASRPAFRDVARLFVPGVHYVVWEGTSDPEAGGGHVVCLSQMSDLDTTLTKRRVDPGWMIAISGVVAGKGGGDIPAVAVPGAPAALPVIDATQPTGAAALADLVMRWFGEGLA